MIEVSSLYLECEEYARKNIFSRGEVSQFTALKDINCKFTEGEIVAILGKNGAGKSTFLNCIAGETRPSSGKIKIKGRVVKLSGSDPGFDRNLTGKQNLEDLAAAYGVRKEEEPEFTKSIMEFASLGDAINRNFGGYSTGMAGKLGFGFITALDTDILLVDETLGVGDLEFRKKASERLEKFIYESGIVLISTHSLNLAKKICSRGIVIVNGRVDFDGKIDEAVQRHIDNSSN